MKIITIYQIIQKKQGKKDINGYNTLHWNAIRGGSLKDKNPIHKVSCHYLINRGQIIRMVKIIT